MQTEHAKWEGTRAITAATLASALALAANRVADRRRWPCGGYGYLGVCSDSAAAVEAAMRLVETPATDDGTGACSGTTVHGLRGHGPARMALARECLDLAAHVEKGRSKCFGGSDAARSLERSLVAVARAVQSLPGDVVVLPQDQHSAARRLKASIGPSWREDGSPFLLHKQTLTSVDNLLAHFSRENLGE